MQLARFSPSPLIRAALLAAGILLTAAAPRSQPCIDYADYVHFEGDTWAYEPQDVAAFGAHVYLADGAFEVIDVTHPDSPVHVGEIETIGARGVAVAQGLAYVAAGTAGFFTVDVSDPNLPRVIGSVDTPGEACAVAIHGGFAYVADGSSGLQVIDLGVATAPRIVGSIDTPGNASHVRVAGSRAYVADGSSGLQVIDISSPTAPAILGNLPTAGYALRLAVAGDHVYVAGWYTPLLVVDVSDPRAPALVTTGIRAVDVFVSGSTAYVVGYEGLSTLDISNPKAPQPLGSVLTPGRASVVTVAGSYAYVGDQRSSQEDEDAGFRVLDITNPRSPGLLGSTPTAGEAIGLAVSGHYAYVAEGSAGLEVVDILNPSAPTVVGRLATGPTRGLAVRDKYAFVLNSEALLVLDISNPAAPHFLVSHPGYWNDIALAGSYACVTGGFRILDLSDPLHPADVGRLDIGGNALTVSGARAYVVESFGNLDVIDISNPRAPRIVGSAPLQAFGFVQSIAVSGSYAYVATEYFDLPSGYSYLEVFDISDPTTPREVSSLHTPGQCTDLAISGSTLYLSDGYAGLQVLDITIPGTPAWRGSIGTPGQGRRVAVAGDAVIVADGWAGVAIAPLQCGAPTGISGSVADVRLHENFLIAQPNPARDHTSLRFELPRGGEARLQVFDTAGRRVRDLVDAPTSSGSHVAYWDGRNDGGRAVACGTYFVRLTGRGCTAQRRVTLVR